MGLLAAQGSNFSVKADTIEYDMQSGDGMAKGNVVLKQDGGTATAANADLTAKQNRQAELAVLLLIVMTRMLFVIHL